MDIKNPEIIRTRDGSNLRISDDLNELEINKFQPRIQNLEKVGDLEILEEELLIDMNHGEINKFRIQDGIVQDIGKISPDFQFKAQDPERVGYRESLGENGLADEETALADKEDHAVYRRTDEFRKTDDFKKTDKTCTDYKRCRESTVR